MNRRIAGRARWAEKAASGGRSAPSLRTWAWAIAIVWGCWRGNPAPAQAPAVAASGAAARPFSEVAIDPSVTPTAISEAPVEFAPTAPAGYSARVVMGPLGTIRESIFGPASKENWTPLTLGSFFREGWDKAYVNAPEGDNGAPKQDWTGTANGLFLRLASVDFFYTNHLTKNPGLFLNVVAFSPLKPKTTGAPGNYGNQYTGAFNILLPLNQRLELAVTVPFITSVKSTPTGGYIGNFGDLTITPRFRLIEQKNFSLVAAAAVRIPTGRGSEGNAYAAIVPDLSFWWNFAPKWVARGAVGMAVPTQNKVGTDVVFEQIAVGRYLTTKDASLFKELVVYLGANNQTDVAGRAKYINDIYLAPGFRFGLGGDQKWYVNGNFQVSVGGPQPYAYQPNIVVLRNY